MTKPQLHCFLQTVSYHKTDKIQNHTGQSHICYARNKSTDKSKLKYLKSLWTRIGMSKTKHHRYISKTTLTNLLQLAQKHQYICSTVQALSLT